MLNKTGVPTPEDIAGVTPSRERFARGPVAVVECFQQIPCNPCRTSCVRGAITLTDINRCPTVDHDKCNGCGVCVSNCPGLAICVVDMTYAHGMASVRLPYEFAPLPREGDTVRALDREGRYVCPATVARVVNHKSMDRTPTVTLAVPAEYAMTVRFFENGDASRADDAAEARDRPAGCGQTPAPQNAPPMHADDAIVCRCEEVTVGDVKALIAKGCTTVDEIKRLSRAGMGACQGRTCRQLIMQILAEQTGVPPAGQRMPTFRPPVTAIKMNLLLEEEGCGHD